MENPFSLKGKTMGQTLNNFTIVKLITIILVCVSQLKKISLIFLCSLTHTNYLSQRWQHFVLFFLFSSPCIVLSLGYFPFSKQFSLGCSLFFLCVTLLQFFSFLICGTPTCFLYTKKLQPP